MLGLSLGKLLVLAAIIAVVWYGFKYIQRVEAVRQALQREMRRRQGGERRGPDRPTLQAEDLVKCRQCGAYVPAQTTTACGRADCPWSR